MSKCGKALIAVLLVIALSLFLLPGTAVAQEEKPRVSLSFYRTDYNSEVTPGEENVLYLKILNRGNIPAKDIRISVEPPKEWAVKVSPTIIDYLGVDAEKTIDILVTPDKYADRGSHGIQLIAEADGVKDTITIYVKVNTATTIWTWIGAGIACLAIAGSVFVFRRFGKN